MTSDPTMSITGARQRQERFTVLQKWVSRALAGNLSCLIVPGPEVALSHGLDVTGREPLSIWADRRRQRYRTLIFPRVFRKPA